MSVKVFGADYLDSLSAKAATSPRLRQHQNIHTDYADLCQRLFNAIEPNSYMRPHMHRLVPKDELMIGIRGEMALVVFDDDGRILEVRRFGAEYAGGQIAAAVETPPGFWHTVVALQPGSILLEVKAGPFDPAQPKEPAPWAPEEGSPEAQAYLQNLIAKVRSAAL
jgi:cupin fold WbuC family metalloprotein